MSECKHFNFTIVHHPLQLQQGHGERTQAHPGQPIWGLRYLKR